MLSMAINLGGVVVAAALLGVEVWVVGIVAFGYVVTRPALGPRAIATALLALAVSAVIYVTIVIPIGALLST